MTIGVAFSTTPPGHAALRVALRESMIRSTDLIVLNVTDTPEHAEDPTHVARVRAEVESQLAAAEVDPLPEWSVINEATQGNLSEAIVDLAEQAGVEILVIGSRRRSAVGKLVMGSTVRQVLMHAPMPVLVVKP